MLPLRFVSMSDVVGCAHGLGIEKCATLRFVCMSEVYSKQKAGPTEAISP